MAWKRYKDPVSGDEFTADERAGNAMGLKPLDKDGVDDYGRPIAEKPNVDKSGARTVEKSTDKKDS